ncbi:hypothetical protein DL96DRAFT_464625 [Flagelloscypha sp. PMI_526]|nr:hypothetical protein DL96DRAFT_464625 [Flagelloscypha sp. PMI_526]
MPRADGAAITVHSYNPSDRKSSRSQDISLASNLVLGQNQSLWNTPSAASNELLGQTQAIVYAFHQPPRCEVVVESENNVILPWGTPPLDEELSPSLDAFPSSDFASLIPSIFAHQTSVSLRNKRQSLPRHDLNLISSIPLPHIHTSPYIPLLPSPTGSQFPVYAPIFPATISPIPPQSRRAWIIPLRGKLPAPWQASSADIYMIPLPLHPSVSDSEIRWNLTCVIQLWRFLIFLRDKHTFGPIGISYRPGLPPHLDSELHFSGPDLRLTTHSLKTADVLHVSLRGQYAMHFRTALDEWACLCRLIPGRTSVRVRPLTGARLALLDERSEGVLVA